MIGRTGCWFWTVDLSFCAPFSFISVSSLLWCGTHTFLPRGGLGSGLLYMAVPRRWVNKQHASLTAYSRSTSISLLVDNHISCCCVGLLTSIPTLPTTTLPTFSISSCLVLQAYYLLCNGLCLWHDIVCMSLHTALLHLFFFATALHTHHCTLHTAHHASYHHTCTSLYSSFPLHCIICHYYFCLF